MSNLGYSKYIAAPLIDYFPCNTYQRAYTAPSVRLGKRGYHTHLALVRD